MNEARKGFKARHKNKVASIEPTKPRNYVAKNAINSGAGAHKDKKKSMKQGDTKHKKDYAEGMEEQFQKQLDKLNEVKMTEIDLDEACWKNYKQIGMKKKGGKTVPNCVPKEGVAEGTRYTGAGIHPKLVEILKQRGYKGPYQLGKLKKWFAHLKDDVGAQATDEIMVTGNDVEYDAWVLKERYGEYAFGAEIGYMTGNANKVIKNTAPISEQGVAEGLPQTLRKVVPGHAKREIDKKMDAGKFGKTDADKDANFQRYKKIQDKLKEQGVAEGIKGAVAGGAAGALLTRTPSGAMAGADISNTLGDMVDEDAEGDTIKNSLHTIIRVATHLEKAVDDEEDFEEWVSEKVGAIKSMMVQVMDYVISYHEQQDGDRLDHGPEQETDEEIAPGIVHQHQHGTLKHTSTAMEGSKVDRQAKHITKSMMKSHPGMSKDSAEAAAWAHIKHPKKKKKIKEDAYNIYLEVMLGKKLDK